MSSFLYSTLISNIPLWEKSKHSKDFSILTHYSLLITHFHPVKLTFPAAAGR